MVKLGELYLCSAVCSVQFCEILLNPSLSPVSLKY